MVFMIHRATTRHPFDGVTPKRVIRIHYLWLNPCFAIAVPFDSASTHDATSMHPVNVTEALRANVVSPKMWSGRFSSVSSNIGTAIAHDGGVHVRMLMIDDMSISWSKSKFMAKPNKHREALFDETPCALAAAAAPWFEEEPIDAARGADICNLDPSCRLNVTSTFRISSATIVPPPARFSLNLVLGVQVFFTRAAVKHSLAKSLIYVLSAPLIFFERLDAFAACILRLLCAGVIGVAFCFVVRILFPSSYLV